jgi:GT2 family glycosyltransferase
VTQPHFSVIIPTHARPEGLAACLEALSNLDYPRDRFEVIVVDDGSDIPPHDVVRRFSGRLDVVLLTQPHAGPATARNTAAARARGEVLAFTDDDCAPASDWLTRLASRFAQDKRVAVGGRTINALPADPYAAASQLIMDVVYAYYNTDGSRARFVASNNVAFPKDAFHAVGGFDSTFPLAAEDRDLCDRWVHRGFRIVYAPEVVVRHAHRMGLRGYSRQHFGYGRGAYRFQRARVSRRSGSLVKELGFYRSLPGLVRRSLAQTAGPKSFRPIALLAVWQVANASGFLWEWGAQTSGRYVNQLWSKPRMRNLPVETDGPA